MGFVRGKLGVDTLLNGLDCELLLSLIPIVSELSFPRDGKTRNMEAFGLRAHIPDSYCPCPFLVEVD